MLKTTFIARQCDGLILCETYDSSTDNQVERLKMKARELLCKGNSIAGNQCSVTIEDHRFHYMNASGVVFLVVAGKDYPVKLAFIFLSELSECFIQEMQNTWGAVGGIDYQSKVETIDRPYAFNNFEKTINRKRKEFRDTQSNQNIDKLNEELMDVSKIMVESFDMLLNRGKGLGKLEDKAADIKMHSANLKKEAKNLKLAYLFKQYQAPIIACLIVSFLFILKVYLF